MLDQHAAVGRPSFRSLRPCRVGRCRLQLRSPAAPWRRKRSRRRVGLFFGLGHESDLFYTDLIDHHVTPSDAEYTEAHLCGGRAMIESCCEKLAGLGSPEEVSRYERFF